MKQNKTIVNQIDKILSLELSVILMYMLGCWIYMISFFFTIKILCEIPHYTQTDYLKLFAIFLFAFFGDICFTLANKKEERTTHKMRNI